MVVVDNTEGVEVDIPGSNPLISFYSYPKKHFSKKYPCLPNAGKVVNAYKAMISGRGESQGRLRLRSVCQSPDGKYFPIYSKIFLQKFSGKKPQIWVKICKYLLELPGVAEFEFWRDLKKEKPSNKKNKLFVVTCVDQAEELLKELKENRLIEFIDVGVIGVKPSQALMQKNLALATDDIIKMVDFITERGFNLSSVKPKLMRHIGFGTNASFNASLMH